MTSFTMEMAELKKKINFVRNGLGMSKTDLPVMLIRMELTNSLRMFTFNKEMFCQTEAKVLTIEKSDGPTQFAVMGNKLEKLISQVEAEVITFNVDDENMEIKAGFLTVNFELYDGSVLATVQNSIADEVKVEGIAIPMWALSEGLSCAKSCQTITSIRPDITHVEIRNSKILSSDGRKIMIYHADAIPEKLHMKIPGSVLSDTVSASKNVDAEYAQVLEGKNYFFVKAGVKQEYVFGVRKVDRSFPKVEEQVAKVDNPTDTLTVDKNVLEAMLKGVALGLPSDEVGVLLGASQSGVNALMEVSAKNSLGRRSFERVSCGRKAKDPVEVPVSFKHLLDTVGVFKGDSVVDLMVVKEKSVLMIIDKTEQREVKTVIPFRTKEAIEMEEKEKQEMKKTKAKVEDATPTDMEEVAETG